MTRLHGLPRWCAVGTATGVAAALAVLVGGAAAAASTQPPVGLGTAASFAVLAGTTVTNTGASVISGDLGVSPGTAITGFPPGVVIHGTEYKADTVAKRAQADLKTAYLDAAGRTPATTVSADLGGQTLAPGVYKATSGLGLTGTVTLDGQSNPNAVFIFQAGSTLITASSSRVSLIGGAQACNVFWQVGSSATLGTNSTFVGNILALTSASVKTGATVHGRVLAQNGQVSLDTNTITASTCTTATASATASATPSPTSTAGSSTPGVPGTGALATPRAGDGVLLALGGLALLGAGVAMGPIRRRSRRP
ncbi:MAG TPA: ice-binding family protein [Candidatus Dormibacteraeota bacterium]|nr:ice-binding family protein [Candidatus Dormibacteraeota bacterium]